MTYNNDGTEDTIEVSYKVKIDSFHSMKNQNTLDGTTSQEIGYTYWPMLILLRSIRLLL